VSFLYVLINSLTKTSRHPATRSRDPSATKLNLRAKRSWIPAFAGMTIV